MNELMPFLEINEVMPLLNKIAIFGGLRDRHLYEIFHKLKKVHFYHDSVIFKQNDSPKNIYIIFKGKVRLIETVNCHPYQLMELKVGDCIGEAAIIGIQPHSVTALAVGDVELLVLSKKDLLDFYNNDKELFSILILNIAREIARRLSITDNLLLHYIDNKKSEAD